MKDLEFISAGYIFQQEINEQPVVINIPEIYY